MVCTIYETEALVWNDRMKACLFHSTICDFGENEFDFYVGY